MLYKNEIIIAIIIPFSVITSYYLSKSYIFIENCYYSYDGYNGYNGYNNITFF